MVAVQVLETCVVRCVGSSPSEGTMKIEIEIGDNLRYVLNQMAGYDAKDALKELFKNLDRIVVNIKNK